MERRLRMLVDLHRSTQGGKGSGIDVAASCLGGVVRYRLADNGSAAEATPISLPDGLETIFIWTGRSSSTGEFLDQLHIRLAERPDRVRPALDLMGTIASDGAAAVSDDDAGGFLAAVDQFWDGLDRLGVAMRMPILSEEHRALRWLAVECGVHYKPSGAGGGDLGIAFTTDGAAASEMASRAIADGFSVLDLHVDPSGLAVSSS